MPAIGRFRLARRFATLVMDHADEYEQTSGVRSWHRGFGAAGASRVAARSMSWFSAGTYPGKLGGAVLRASLAGIPVMGDPGFEPGTSALSERRSNQLS
jgi:hypothetical protein